MLHILDVKVYEKVLHTVEGSYRIARRGFGEILKGHFYLEPC